MGVENLERRVRAFGISSKSLVPQGRRPQERHPFGVVLETLRLQHHGEALHPSAQLRHLDSQGRYAIADCLPHGCR